MGNRKSTVDWPRIELEYLAGEDSIREIADRHEISDTAIRKRAKTEKWVRKVRRREPANQAPKAPPTAPPAADVPVEAPGIADRGRSLVNRMMSELDAVTSHLGEMEEIIREECGEDRTNDRRVAMMKAISLDARANTLKTLSLALKTLNEASAPQGKKAQAQDRANAVASKLRPIGPPTLKAVK